MVSNRKLVVGFLTAVAMMVVFLPSVVLAGQYSFVSCSDPLGQISVPDDSSDHWREYVTGSSNAEFSCSKNGNPMSIWVNSGSEIAGNESPALWLLSPTSNITIDRYVLDVTAGSFASGGPYSSIDFQVNDGANWIHSSNLNGTSYSNSSLSLSTVSGGGGGYGFGLVLECNNDGWDGSTHRGCYPTSSGPQLALYGARIYASESVDPSVSEDGDSELSGTVTLDVSASDGESGVEKSTVYIDGSAYASYDGTCLWNDFDACEASYTHTYSIDTTELSEGSHNLYVQSEDAAGNTAATSTRTITVDNITPPSAPTDGSGTVDGTLNPGEELTCNPGAFTGTDLTYTYQWYRDSSAISGATSSSYTIKSADTGHTLSCRVTATNSEGSDQQTIEAGKVTEASVASNEQAMGSSTATTTSSTTASSTSSGSTGSVSTNTASSSTPTASASTANGEGASRSASISAIFGQSRSKRVLVKYGKRVSVTGRLVDPDGKPITDAVLTVLAKIALPGEDWEPVDRITTDSDGSFKYVAPVGPSRTIRVAYRAYKDDTAYSDVTEVDLGVRAAAKLHVSKHRIRNGQIVKFSGRLLGTPLPKGKGKIVEILALDGRTWRAFGKGTIRANSSGRFKAKYRFTRTFAKTTYKFKARIRAEEKVYPYRAGFSNLTKVTVRP